MFEPTTMKTNFFIYLLSAFVVLAGCRKELELATNVPTEADAAFTFAPTEASDNIIRFSNSSSAFIKQWDLGNGSKVQGENPLGTYPDSGTYTVTLTVYNDAGSASSTQEVYIAQSDPTLLDRPLFNFLTGGAAAPEGKTWVIDSAIAGHFGVGPNPSDPAFGDFPNFYAAGANEKAGGGMYDDRYTFRLASYGFTMQTNGDVYVNTAQAGDFPGAFESSVGDFTAPFEGPANSTWAVAEPEDGYPQLTVTNGSFIGYYTGVSTYQIVNIEENEMFLRYQDAAAPDLAWYLRLIPEGFDSGGGDPDPDPVGAALPITFEGAEPPSFTTFGGSSYAVIDNPDASGINTSARVAETVHGNEPWAGLFVDLDGPLDFSSLTTMNVKLWSPTTGVLRFKLENSANTSEFVEIDADITVANSWQQYSFDLSDQPSGVYDRVVLFPGWDVADAGTFYIDDIDQVPGGECVAESGEMLDPASNLNFNLQSDVFFGQFGNIVAERVANPLVGGLNTSCWVNSYGKSPGCETWSGAGYLLENAIDFATDGKVFTLKVLAIDQTTDVTLRLERLPFPDTEPSVERVATITQTGEWQELIFDFSSEPSENTFQNVIIYFERNEPCDGDQYYFDDLIQSQ